jgi:hypothetical protein
MLSVINGLDLLQGNLLKKFVPSLANAELTPMRWDTAARDLYVPVCLKEIENYVPDLESQTLSVLPGLKHVNTGS